jgi:hypothetical protein
MIDVGTFRTVAVVAAAALVASPAVVGIVWSTIKNALSHVRGKAASPAGEAVTIDDAHTVVEIARRLRKEGNAKGADLCKQLLDVMLASEAKS